MEASPQGLMAGTAGWDEFPLIGGPLHDLNADPALGPTCEGLRWKTQNIVAFAHNTDKNRTAQFNMLTREYAVLRDAGWNTMYAGGGVVATFSKLGYWDSTGEPGREGGNQFPIAVDDLTGSIAIIREDGSGLDCYVGSERIRVFTGQGGYGASFRDGVLTFIFADHQMYRWSIGTNILSHLFDLPSWMRPIAQFSGGWFLGWHNNIGGIVVWQGVDLEHGRIGTQGIDAFSPKIIRVGDEIHVLYASGAGEFIGQGRRLILPLNDVNQWPLQNLLDPNVGPPVPPIPPIPPIPPVEDDMLPTLLASHLHPYWENPSKTYALQGDAGDPRWLRLNLEGVISWRAGINGPGGIESDSAFNWTPGQTTATAYRNGTIYTFKVQN